MSFRSFSSGRKSASARAYGYLKAARQGRQSVTAWLNVPISVANYDEYRYRVWELICKDPMFFHFASVYDEVAIRRVHVSAQLTSYSNTALVNASQFSTAVCHYWDRNGTDYDRKVTYSEAQRRSSAKVSPGIQYGKPHSFYDSLTPTTAQEKQLYLPTETLYLAFMKDNNDLKTRINTLTNAWNPAFVWILKDGKASFTLQFKIQVIFRTVRYQEIEYAPPDDDDDGLQYPEYDIHVTQLVKAADVDNDYRDIHSLALYAGQLNKNRDYIAPVFQSLDSAKQEYYGYLKNNRDCSQLVAYLTKAGTDQPLGVDVNCKRLKFSTYKADPRSTAAANANKTLISTDVDTPMRLGQLTRAEDDEFNTGVNRLIADGKLYDPAYGGISAVGYMDLMGPPDQDDTIGYNFGIHTQGNAWVECGNKTDQELYDINLTNTGPDYVEVTENDDQFTQAIMPGILTYNSTKLSQSVDVTEGPYANGIDIFIPQILQQIAAAAGIKIQLTVNFVDTVIEVTRSEQMTFGDTSSNIIFQLVSETVIADSDIQVDPTITVHTAYKSGNVITPNNIPLNVSDNQLLNLYRLCLPSSTYYFDYHYTANISTGIGYKVTVPMIPIMPTTSFFTMPVEASKFWARIKSTFTKAFKWVAKLSRKVTPILSTVIPQPYGTVVGTVGSAITAIDTALNLGATTSQANSLELGSLVEVDDNDGFDVTLQYRLAIPGSEPADITKHGSDWIDGQTTRVPLKGVDSFSVSQLSYIQQDAPQVWRDIQLYRQAFTGEDQGISYQVRLKVVFQKKMTQEQANAFRATLRLGYEVDTTDVPLLITEEQ